MNSVEPDNALQNFRAIADAIATLFFPLSLIHISEPTRPY